MNEDCFVILLVWLFSLRGLPASLTVDAFNTVIELLPLWTQASGSALGGHNTPCI